MIFISFVMIAAPQFGSVSSAVPHLTLAAAATCCNYNFSVSPGAYNSQTGVWTVPPNTILTVNGSTNDVSVTLINMTGTSADGYRFTVQAVPSSCGSNCLFVSTTIPANNDKAGDTWSIVANFSKGSGSSETTRAEIYPTVIVTPEFPMGTILAVAAPLGAIGFYLFLAKRRVNHAYPRNL